MHVLLQLAGIVLALAALPLLLELLVLSLAALAPPRKVLKGTQAIRLAVVIPAHNEAKLIGLCVGSLLASDAGAQIYVVAHNCDDETAAFAEGAGASALILNDAEGGKGRALDHGFHHAVAAGAQGVLIIDADSIVSTNLLPTVTARLSAGIAALQCRYEVANVSASPRTRLAALAFLGMNVLRPRGRDRLGLSCGIFGNGFALAASTLQAVPYTANSLVEDLEYHLHLIRAGLRVEFVDEAVVLGEMPVASAAAQTQRARWEGGRLLMRRQWTMPLMKEVAAGHFRFLEPLLDLLAYPLATEAALLAGVVALSWPAHSLALALYGATGLLTLVLYVVVAASLSPQPGATLRALAEAPAFIAWKLLTLPATRRAAKRDAAWVRTKRNEE